jgi:hypothetical protein
VTLSQTESAIHHEQAEHKATKYQLRRTEAELANLFLELMHAREEVRTLRDAQVNLGKKFA